MKNIHILPTSQPSRLIFNSLHKSFCYQKEIDGMYINDGKVSGADFWSLQKALNNGFKPQHIYITSDEEIKKGDWTLMFDDLGNLFLCDKPQQYLGYLGIEKGHHLNKGLRKIILTTDQDLIKDDVQAIDDEFLEWFVKNPSCEAVKVIDEIIEDTSKDYIIGLGQPYTTIYKIIIPKEELHSMDDEVECNMCGNIMSLLEDESNYACFNNECTRCYEEYEEEPKQETLEELIKQFKKK